jgi:hypothetical protein
LIFCSRTDYKSELSLSLGSTKWRVKITDGHRT